MPVYEVSPDWPELHDTVLPCLLQEEEDRNHFRVWRDNADFIAPLTTSIVPLHGAGSPTFVRATPKAFIDFEGCVRTGIAGEACFTGGRRVQNLLVGTEALAGAGWASVIAGTGTAASATAGFIAPDGSATAFRVQANRGASATTNDISAWAASGSSTGIGQIVNSVWIKSNTGSNQVVLLSLPAAGLNDVVTATPTWQRLATPPKTFAASSSNGLCIGTRGTLGSDQVIDVLVWHPQMELVTGQSNQNPSEYVSVGVLSAPYHGANVDGVKYFATTNGNTVSGNVVTEATGAAIGLVRNQSAYTTGLTGSYFSTPDSPANSITGTLDLRFDVAPAVWPPAATVALGGHWDDTGLNFGYLVRANTAGQIIFNWYDGTTNQSKTSNALTASSGTRFTLRVFFDAVASQITFYSGPTILGPWTPLGAPQAMPTNVISDRSALFTVGAYNAGGSNPMAATFYRAQLYAGNGDAGGTLVVDFNPNDYASGNTWTSGLTGETWTKNGGASILNFPLFGYDSWQASTNLVLQSENFGTTWVPVGTPTRVAAALRCGDVVLDLLGDDDAAATEYYNQTVTFTGDGTKAFSIHFAQGTSTISLVNARDVTAAANRGLITITWSGGAPIATPSAGAVVLGVDALAGGVYRLRFTAAGVVAANSNRIEVYPASTNGGVTETGTIYFGGVQVENSAFCTPYIATTTVTVTRNADQLSYPSAGNAATAAGTVYAECAPNTATAVPGCYAINDGSVNNRVDQRGFSTAQNVVSSGGVTQANITIAGAYTTGVISKSAQAWAANDSRFVVNGVAGTPDTSVTAPAAFTQILIGGLDAGGSQPNGNVRNVRIWKQAAPDSFLQRMTA